MKLHLKLFLVLVSFMALFSTTDCCNSSNSTTVRYINNQQNTNHMMNSVVAVVVNSPLSGRMIGCSGFFVSPTQIVTAEHCVETHHIGITVSPDGEPNFEMVDNPPTTNMDVEYVTYADWRQWQSLPASSRHDLPTHHAHVARWNEETDVAVLTTPDLSTNWLPMRSTAPVVGERVYTVSQPGHLRWMFSEGIVSQVEVIEGRTFIMATPSIYMGSSGCPLIDNNGQVVGIADAMAYRQSTFGLFVPIANARSLMPVVSTPARR